MPKIPVIRKVSIKNKLMGGYQVVFQCPHCKRQLKSNEDDVGKPDQCPECNGPFFLHQDIAGIIENKEKEKEAEKQKKLKEKNLEAEKAQKEKEVAQQQKEKEKELKKIKKEIKQNAQSARKKEQQIVGGKVPTGLEGVEELYKEPVKILDVYSQLCNGVAFAVIIIATFTVGYNVTLSWYNEYFGWAIVLTNFIYFISSLGIMFLLLLAGALVKCFYLVEKNSRLTLIEIKQLKFHTIKAQREDKWAGGWKEEPVDEDNFLDDDEDGWHPME